MNPLLSKRIPACVWTLLTDIEPRGKTQYWEDDDEVPINRDGVTLPVRGSARLGEILAPASETTEGKPGVPGIETQSRVCGLCLTKPLRYTCPRCNTPYCSLTCYQSPAHSMCSEEFYKESVFQELRSTGTSEAEGKKQMQEILMRLKDKEKGGMEDALRELEEGGHGRMEDNRQVLDLLSRLAELQESGVEERHEIEDILSKLRDVGGDPLEREHVEEIPEAQRDLEKQSGKEEEDLVKRLSGLDLESLSEEQLWALLPQQDKEKFEGLVKEGAIGGLVPLWKPWWERHEEGKEALMELLEDNTLDACSQQPYMEVDNATEKYSMISGDKDEKDRHTSSVDKPEKKKKEEGEAIKVNKTDWNENDVGQKCKVKIKSGDKSTVSLTKQKCTKTCKPQKEQDCQGLKSREGVPPVSAKIPPLCSLSSHISPLVRYNLVNVLYGYTFSLCLYNGDVSVECLAQDFCQVALAISESLSSSRVFGSLQEALDGGAMAMVKGAYVDQRDVAAPFRNMEAVAHVLIGRSARDQTGYCLAALSQLRVALNQARKRLSSDGEEGELRQKFFFAGKKCEFLQSWVKDNGLEVRQLAREVWAEWSKREGEREVLEKEKKEVENSWKKGQGRKKRVMIEEID